MIRTNQFKNGNHIEVEGTVFKILEFQHVKPGKGGAFVRTKLRRAADGAVIDRTFRAGEKFRPVRTEARKMQFLYADGTDAHFMDEGSYEQLAIPEPSSRSTLKWVKPSETVDLLFIDDEPSDIQLAASVELEVTHTEPGVKGDTASGGGNKPATLETGATVQRAAVREHRRQGQGRHALGLVHVARVSAMAAGPSNAAPRSSPSTSTTSPVGALDDVFERDAGDFTRALAHATADNARRARRADRARTPRAGRSTGSRRSSGRSCAPRCWRCSTPTWSRPTSRSRPRARSTRRSRPRRRSAAPTRPGFVNGILGAVLREVRENGGAHAA